MKLIIYSPINTSQWSMICNFDSLKFVWTIYFVSIGFELGESLDDVKYVSTLLSVHFSKFGVVKRKKDEARPLIEEQTEYFRNGAETQNELTSWQTLMEVARVRDGF